VCITAFRVKKLDCFSACNYQIGDRAYYLLKPEDRLISLGSSVRCDKPAVLHTFLHQRGLLPVNSHNESDMKVEEKTSSELATDVSAADASTVSDGIVSGTSKVIFSVRFIHHHYRVACP